MNENVTEFEKGLRALLNEESEENESDTPDFILAEYLKGCLDAFNLGVNRRSEWYNRPDTDSRVSKYSKAHKARCVEVAGRIWCDQEMRDIPMDSVAAFKIAEILEGILVPRNDG